MAGLYIHIPFCTRKCLYCDFYSCTQTTAMPAYIDTVKREMRARADYLGGKALNTIYFGGGTPSLCTPEQIEDIINEALIIFEGNPVEITLEANPDDLTPEYLTALAMTRVNRLSIGIQSFRDRDLRFMNRRHSAHQAIDAVQNARKAGFDNITVDLIFGIPGMTDADWTHNLEQAIDLSVEHISAYHLTIEDGTPLADIVATGELAAVDEDTSERQYLMLHNHLTKAGFDHYEISNFAKPGRRAIHNGSYWKGKPYIGIGPSAHSFNGSERRFAEPSIERYLAQIPSDAIYTVDILSESDKYNEFIMVGLRCAEGIEMEELTRKFGSENRNLFIAKAGGFVREGLMRQENDIFRIVPENYLVSDMIISELFIE